MSRGQLAVLAAAAAVVVLACSVAEAATWPNTTNPTTTAAGSEAIVRSQCYSFGGCQFFTADHGTFGVLVPASFISKFPDGTKVDAMDVIKAVLARKNTLNLSAIPSATTISPAYAAKLARVGVTPTKFLGWLYMNVPASERPPWVPGSANRPAIVVQKAVSPSHPVLDQGAVSLPPKVQTPEANHPQPSAYPKPAPHSPNTAPKPDLPSGTVSTPTFEARGATSQVASAGTVTPHARACPPGYSELNASSGGRCLPDRALDVNPMAKPWWRSSWVRYGAVGALIILLATGVGVVGRRRRRATETP